MKAPNFLKSIVAWIAKPFVEAPVMSELPVEVQVAIGAFGAFVTALQGHWVNPFGVMLHAGVVVYAWVRRSHLFS